MFFELFVCLLEYSYLTSNISGLPVLLDDLPCPSSVTLFFDAPSPLRTYKF